MADTRFKKTIPSHFQMPRDLYYAIRQLIVSGKTKYISFAEFMRDAVREKYEREVKNERR